MKCIIVDDEPLALQVLENFISRTPELQLVGKCTHAGDAFQLLHSRPVELMFLDIRMPGINGLDFVRSLKSPPAVIFTTAFAEHAVTGFELEAADYLLKPITYERFEKSIQRLLKTYRPEAPVPKTYTYFKVSGQLVKVHHAELQYAQSVKDYILLHTASGNYLTHMTMKYLDELLPEDLFLRVHRSYLVNRSFVDKASKNTIYLGKQVIPIGENYRQIVGSIF
ncbi:MAG: response regulator transcription factor [Sphingobacteriaceae bacterium]|nr:MAG: response regulator transcription factor [Sphingobacteriaceae bacterium]